MRLSTAADRDDAGSIQVIHAALQAGVTLLDTADAYGLDDSDLGHNERLIRRALESFPGDASGVAVSTKGGLRRPGGRWVPDGRAKHLVSACEASLRALGVEGIDLYLLHAPDPKTPLKTSVRALGRLKKAGKARKIGLCNVTLTQLREAQAVADIDAVQVALSLSVDEALRNGLVEFCARHQIQLIAHTPLGGVKQAARLARRAGVSEVGQRHACTPADVALAWLLSLSPTITPIPGARRVETAGALGRPLRLELSADDLHRLDAESPAADIVRRPMKERRPPVTAEGDIVVVMGSPGAGKSTLARELEQSGYLRLNRDEEGGSLSGLVSQLDEALSTGTKRVVLDNTYPRRSRRNEVIETSWRHRVPVRCRWMDTSHEQAQVNAVNRILDAFGRLLSPEELAAEVKRNPAALPPRALNDYRRAFEPPTTEEGFEQVERIAFRPAEAKPAARSGLIIEVEGVLRTSRPGRGGPRSVEDVIVRAERAAVLRAVAEQGAVLVGLSWVPGLSDGSVTAARVSEMSAHLAAELGIKLDLRVCPHAAGPPVCWCRKPLPGLVLAAMREHELDGSRTRFVGKSRVDENLAAIIGLDYVDHDDFFS
jgi:aryl-alcohol dehydrogenase-like predicted oxidoreductase/histidinol phosphatase-like enzyme/adenylate kinase family enzyme